MSNTVPTTVPADRLARLARPALFNQSQQGRSGAIFKDYDGTDVHTYPYGSDRFFDWNAALSLICTDQLTAQEKIDGPLKYLIQRGIDLGRATIEYRSRTGLRAFTQDGAWNVLISAPIALAGRLLGITELENLPKVNLFSDEESIGYVDAELVTITNKTIFPTSGTSVQNRAGQSDQLDFWYPFTYNQRAGLFDGFKASRQPFQSGMNHASYPRPFFMRDIGGGETLSKYSGNAHWAGHPYQELVFGSRTSDILVRLAYGLENSFDDLRWRDAHLLFVTVKQGGTDPWIGRGGMTPASYTAVSGTPSVNTSMASDFSLELRRKHWTDASLLPWA